MKKARTPREAAPAKRSKKKSTGRGNPDGPPVRGRRGHGTVDDNPELKKIVNDLYFDHPDWTIDQKVDFIHEQYPDFHLSWSALQRFYDKFEKELVERETMQSLARSLKADVEEDGLMLSAVGGELAQSMLFRAMLAGEALEPAEVTKIELQARLQSSAATRERARKSRERDIRSAIALVKEDIRKTLRLHPDMAERLASMIDARTEGLIEERSR